MYTGAYKDMGAYVVQDALPKKKYGHIIKERVMTLIT